MKLIITIKHGKLIMEMNNATVEHTLESRASLYIETREIGTDRQGDCVSRLIRFNRVESVTIEMRPHDITLTELMHSFLERECVSNESCGDFQTIIRLVHKGDAARVRKNLQRVQG